MKDFKTLYILALLLAFLQCKKENKDDHLFTLLPNGKYILYLETDPQGHSSSNYYLKDNLFYVLRQYTADTICFSRVAGELFKNANGALEIITLNDGFSSNPCVFANDKYGGDTMIYHFSNVSELDFNSKKGLKGDFYNIVRSGLPYSRQEGKFTFGPY